MHPPMPRYFLTSSQTATPPAAAASCIINPNDLLVDYSLNITTNAVSAFIDNCAAALKSWQGKLTSISGW